MIHLSKMEQQEQHLHDKIPQQEWIHRENPRAKTLVLWPFLNICLLAIDFHVGFTDLDEKKCSPWHRGGGSLPKEAVSSQCAELI